MRIAVQRLATLSTLLLALSAVNSHAADKTWVSVNGGLWSLPANWSPAGAPTATDDLIFNQAASSNSTINGNFTFSSLRILAGYAATINSSPNSSITVNGVGGVTQSGGTLDLSAGDGNTFASTFTLNAGTFILPGFANSFQNIVINGGTFDGSVSGNVNMDTLTQTGGIFTAPSTIQLAGSWLRSGGMYNHNMGSVSFGSATAFSIDAGAASGPFNNVTLFNSGACTLINSNMLVSGTFDMTFGGMATEPFRANGRDLTVTGLATITSGNFMAESGVISFNGGLVLAGFTLGLIQPLNGTLTCGSGTLNVTNFTLQGDNSGFFGVGTLVLGTGAFNCSGDWSLVLGATPPVFIENTGTISFTKTSGTQTLDAGGGTDGSFFGLTHSGTGTLQVVNNNLTVSGPFTNSAGTFDSNGKNVFASGGFTNVGPAIFDTKAGIAQLSNGINFNGGTVKAAAPGAIALFSAVNVNANTTVQGVLALNAGGLTPRIFTVAPAAATFTVEAQITGGVITKAGPGTMLVTSTTSTNSDTTTVTAGTLQVDGALAGTKIQVNSGATLTGKGSVPQISAAAGATVFPGGPGTSTLTATANTAFLAGSIFKADLNGSTAGAFSVLSTGGPISLGDATLAVTALNGLVAPLGTKFKILDNTGALAISGTFAGLVEGATLTGNGRFFKITYLGGNGNDVELTVQNSPPIFSSVPIANPNPATAAEVINFSSAAADPDGTSLTYTWDFGDGTSGDGPTVVHAYAAAGIYDAKVTASDGVFSVTAKISITVCGTGGGGGGTTAPLIGQGLDSDGDGFSDNLETAFGTMSNSATSTPTGSAITAAGIQALTIEKTSIKFNFAKPDKDSISFSGTLAIPAGFTPKDQKVIIDVGGIPKAFTLSDKGAAKVLNDTFKITIKAKKGIVAAQTAKYSINFTKGNFGVPLADEKLTGEADAKKAERAVSYSVIINNTVLQKTQTLTYTAKKSKTGTAK